MWSPRPSLAPSPVVTTHSPQPSWLVWVPAFSHCPSQPTVPGQQPSRGAVGLVQEQGIWPLGPRVAKPASE